MGNEISRLKGRLLQVKKEIQALTKNGLHQKSSFSKLQVLYDEYYELIEKIAHLTAGGHRHP